MLILTRKPGESLYIGDVKVTVVELKGHQIRIGIDAPPEIRIYREEIYLQIMEENKKAAEASLAPESGLEGLGAALQGGTGIPVIGSEGGSGKKPGITPLSAFSTVSMGTGSTSGGKDPEIVHKKRRK